MFGHNKPEILVECDKTTIKENDIGNFRLNNFCGTFEANTT